MRCNACGFENPGGFRFCGQCGAALSADAGAAPAAPADAERRHVTVLICDLVGSTALSQKLDPEDLREVMRAFQATGAREIHRLEGFFAEYRGDGLLAAFGYPVAHEDDGRRAVRAARAILHALDGLNASLEPSRDIRLAVRIGIHTGLVVVEKRGSDIIGIVGEAPNIAARIQEAGAPNTIIISAATHRLAGGFFTCDDLGLQTIRGLSQPMRLYRVAAESGAETWLDVRAAGGLTPLVGREQEMAMLMERWTRVRAGDGEVIQVGGEPGIGKSRLVRRLKERIEAQPHLWLEARGSPYHHDTAYYPIVALLHRAAAWAPADAASQKIEKLEALLSRQGFDLARHMWLLASLLSLPLDETRYPPPALRPATQREHTVDAIVALLTLLASVRPLVVVVEDLQWVDPSSLGLLGRFVAHPAPGLLLVLTFRDTFQSPWSAPSDARALTIQRLSKAETEIVVRHVARARVLPRGVVDEIVAKTDGIPLFVEELTRMVVESGLLDGRGDGSDPGVQLPLAIPSTVQDSLMARLDQLSTVKEVAQLAATLGHEFLFTHLRAVAETDETTLRRELGRLVAADILQPSGESPNETYSFRHALLQEASYESLLRSRRRQYHERIARVLEAEFPAVVESQPEVLAHHFTAAGLAEPAINYWHTAGHRALQRSAQAEGVAHIRKALRQLATLPSSIERDERELFLQVSLAVPLMATEGHASPDVEQAWMRAHEISSRLGESPHLFPVLLGLWTYHLVRGDMRTALKLARERAQLAERFESSLLLVLAHQALGITLFHIGDLVNARAHLEKAVSVYDPNDRATYVLMYDLDPGVTCLAYLSEVLWLLGYPGQALATGDLARSRAQDPLSRALAFVFLASLHEHRGEDAHAQTCAHQAVRIAEENGFAQWLGTAQVITGWERVVGGDADAGIADMMAALTAYGKTGARVSPAYSRTLLARAYAGRERYDDALRVLDDAWRISRANGEGLFEAEIQRLRAENVAASGRPARNADEVGGYFDQALTTARTQQAKSLELRTAMSASRWHAAKGRRAEARQLLEGVYGWFTEGHDTGDLRQARALLDELS